jgi:RNA polymerase sigma-70 factor, ECF subfamily
VFSSRPDETRDSLLSESQAIARLKQSDLSGLEWLVNRYQAKAVQATVLILHDRRLAEEIVQNSFVHAARKIHLFDDRRSFWPWFLRSVVNAALQEINRQRRLVSLEAQEESGSGNIAEWLIDPDLCPEELVENQALYRAVWQALDQLPPHQRAAIVMRYFDDYSEAEITAAFHRPLTTVKWWLHAARQRLRRILQQAYTTEVEGREGDRS